MPALVLLSIYLTPSFVHDPILELQWQARK